MYYLLDTNIVSYLMEQRPAVVAKVGEAGGPDLLSISTISLAEKANGAYNGNAGSLPTVFFDRHHYQPLFKDRGEEVRVSPSGLEESEERFVAALRDYCASKNGGPPPGTKLFLLRNLTRSKGVGFFATSGFYPDFILWVKSADGSQKVVFVEPHGMRNDDPPPKNPKVDLYLALRDLSDRIEERDGLKGVFLASYIVSATPFHELTNKWGGWTRERFAKRHVLFEDDLRDKIPALLEPRDELERRISTSYPAPLASGFMSLTPIVDPWELYKEQLRVAENLLAFLASVSLALLKEEDREKAGLDLKKYWSGGISPGDWREIVGRCSKVFADYRGIPLAATIQKLKILSERKGFGRDVIGLVRAKNDYKHDRGPSSLEDVMIASDEVQAMLRRCMEALAFFAESPMRREEGSDTDHNGESQGGALSLDMGENLVPLFPFIVPMVCPRCEIRETYFVDAWDTKRGTARMKSFERGHTMNNAEVSEALTEWGDSARPSTT